MIGHYKELFLKSSLLMACEKIDSLLGDLSSHSLEFGGKIADYVLEIRRIMDKIKSELENETHK